MPPSHLGGEIFDSLCRRGRVSSPLASLGFRGANPRRLYRRRSLVFDKSKFLVCPPRSLAVALPSIFIPRLKASGPSTRSRWWVTFRLRGADFNAHAAWDFGVMAHLLALKGFGFPLPLCLYYSTDWAICQDFFYFFLPRPAVPLPEARGCVLGAWFTFV